ncbi:MAG: hypothetical protein HDS64_08010 [Bacteroidales bacterium]|nr:hypothetical protein [Bacteroidales bacterium]
MKLKSLAIMALGALALTGCGKQQGGASAGPKIQRMKLACDASFENIMDQEIDVFEYSYSNKKRQAYVVPYYLPQQQCFDSLLNESSGVRTIVAARKLTADERLRLKNHKRNPREQRIAVDAIALIVNNENPQDVISMQEVRDILSGKVTSWHDMWPTKLDSIRLVFDQNGSSLVQFMRDSINGGEPIKAKAYAENSSREVFEAVSRRPNALGVIGVSWITTDMNGAVISREEMRERSAANDTTSLGFSDKIKVLAVSGDESIDAYKPYQAYIFDGRYPLYRSIYMITTGVGGSFNNAFYAFVTGMQGQKVIQMTGVLPATVQPRMVNVSVSGE